MAQWADRRILDLFGIEVPILLAPMAGAGTPDLALAVASAGGLGAIPSAQYSAAQLRDVLVGLRRQTARPLNVNFFCHVPPEPNPVRMAGWLHRLAPYYVEAGIAPALPAAAAGRAPFDDAFCAVVEEMTPEVVSFHFGLPADALLKRVRATGAKVIASATTVAEAVWLEERGVDAVIAQGLEAGGHRGNFLTHDMNTQAGTFALVPQVVDAVRVPVIAAGGIADARGVVAALALGASAAQIGTAYLLCDEAHLAPLHLAALKGAREDATALTNIFTGRPARGVMNRVMRDIGPLAPEAPAFPLAGGILAPLRAKAEAEGRADFTNLWSGQAARLATGGPAGAFTTRLADEAWARIG